jgi:hypothetical protein
MRTFRPLNCSRATVPRPRLPKLWPPVKAPATSSRGDSASPCPWITNTRHALRPPTPPGRMSHRTHRPLPMIVFSKPETTPTRLLKERVIARTHTRSDTVWHIVYITFQDAGQYWLASSLFHMFCNIYDHHNINAAFTVFALVFLITRIYAACLLELISSIT